MNDLDSSIRSALTALRSTGATYDDAVGVVPAAPGLYAIHGNTATWRILGLGDPPDHRPLYVGKAENSLAGRDLGTHFATGKTGSSTLRRSLAALLEHRLRLEARPRNETKPDGSANFGLAPDGDERLTTWMQEHLTISFWPSDTERALRDVETAVLGRVLPPLNLSQVSTEWRPSLAEARRRMADAARRWRPEETHPSLRIAIWNMDHCIKAAQRSKAWQSLRSLGVDVALLQECVPIDGLQSVLYRLIGGTRDWGSAVAGLTVDVTPIVSVRGRAHSCEQDLAASHPGTLAVGAVQIGDITITLVSAYGLIDGGYADTVVNRQLSDLAPLLDDPDRGKYVIFGGDLNITTQWTDRDERYRRWEEATFARIESLGLVDLIDRWRGDGPLTGCGCSYGEACRHVRTQYHPRSSRPWQNDYAYASEALVASGMVKDVRVLDDGAPSPLSQHLPIVIDLSI